MTIAAAATSPRVSVGRIAAAGLAAGGLDLIYATVMGATRGQSFEKVWQGVASGWLGRQAGELGWASAGLGLATHFGIATAMAAAFAAAGARAPGLYRRPLAAGVIYGLILYGVMYRMVLPLRWPEIFPRWDGARSIADIGAHIGVALAIVYILGGSKRRAP